MLNFEELKEKLSTQTPGPGWLHAYIDHSGGFWVRGYGGMGTTIFTKLEPSHPFVGYIETMMEEKSLQQQAFQFEYEANEELALLATISITP